MNRRKFLKNTGLLAASIGLLPTFKCSNKKDKPNIVLILIDDLGWKDVGYMGSDFYETPNIDKLASQGMVFTNAYSNAPNCAPTRASLLTGLYTPRHKIFTVNSSARGKSHLRKLIPTPNTTRLDTRFPTIASTLKEAGYISGSFGKWHLGDDLKDGPLAFGFDMNVGGNHLGHPKNYFSPYKNSSISDGPEGEYLTDRLTDEALEFIDKNQDNPFFLYLTHYTVHTPLQAKKELIKKYQTKKAGEIHNNPTYAAMIESMDESVGRILKKLQELQLEESTIVFFISDNGGHGSITSQEPLRGAKGMLYEGGIRVPMIVQWKGKVKEKTICEIPVMTTDFLPTILASIRKPVQTDIKIDGVSILPLLFQMENFNRETLYWHFPAYLERYRGMTEPWRITPTSAIRDGDWKLLEFFEDGKLELYNLKDDIGEKNNLADSLPEKAEELHEKLKKWRQEINAPVPTELNPGYNPGMK
jgi:arylsulfatase A-like enzyme